MRPPIGFPYPAIDAEDAEDISVRDLLASVGLFGVLAVMLLAAIFSVLRS
jgi:hypothetical protein